MAIAGVGVAAVALLVAVTVFGDRLPWNTTSLPVVAMSMDAPTVIDVPTEVIGSTTVRVAGATVVADDVKIVVPNGAVSADTDVVIQRLNAPFHMDDGAAAGSDALDARPIGPAYDLGPAGTQFGQPVDVTLPYDASIVPDGTDPNQIVVAYYTGTHWAVAGGKADVAAHTVTVRLQAFPGSVVMSALAALIAGIIINRAITYNELKKDPNAYNDQVMRGVAKDWITPDDPAVKAAAAGATAGGVSLSDQAGLAAYMAKQGLKSVKVTLTPGGKPQTATYDGGPGTNWRMPVDYLSRDMKGDCTDATNTMISVFRSLGYKAKGVEGYAGDKGHPHAWGEVLIGDKAYMIDQNGELQLLPGAIELNHLIRADKNDPRDYMWDEAGQEIYKGNWWGPTVLTVTPTTIADGQIDKSYDFKASATGIPDTAESVHFEWYQNSVLDTEWTPGGVLPPYEEPLTTRATFTFHEGGNYLIKVTLFATTEGVREEIAHATVPVKIVAAGTAAGGSWVLVNTASLLGGPGTFADGGAHTTSSNGRIAVSFDSPDIPHGSVSWELPPASALPGDVWNTTLSAEATCGTDASLSGSYEFKLHISLTAPDLPDQEVGVACEQGSRSVQASFTFPGDLGYWLKLSVHGGDSYGGDTWMYNYEWKP